MKELAAGIVFIVVLGFGAFLYRNTVERPGVIEPEQVACTMEAKLCPDGSSVGREGPRCAFTPCPYPNVEVTDADIAFAVPEGYVPDEQAYGADATLIAAFQKPAGTVATHRIAVRRYPIAEEQPADEVILASVRYQPADEQATDFARFADESIAGRTYRATTIERFEGMAYSSYFLVRERDVLRFDIVEQGVAGWMEPSLDVRSLPEHAALRGLLSTLQAGK